MGGDPTASGLRRRDEDHGSITGESAGHAQPIYYGKGVPADPPDGPLEPIGSHACPMGLPLSIQIVLPAE